jgi:hypothetical protein
VVLHVIDKPVTKLERLVLTMDFAAEVDLPSERDDYAGLTSGHDMGFGVGDLQSWLDARAGLTTLENFTSLRRTVSARSGPPP